MKRQNTFLLFLLLNLSLSLSAQTFSLGGNVYATGFKNERKSSFLTSRDNNFTAFLTPSCSVFLTDKLMVGSGMTLGGFHNQNKISEYLKNDFKSFSGAIAPSIRYYFLDKPKWRPFGALQFEYSGSKTKALLTNVSGTIESNSSVSAWNFVPTVGVDYFFSDDVALEFTLQHSETFLKYSTGKSEFNQSSLGIGLQNFLTIKKAKKSNKSFQKETPPSKGILSDQYLHTGKWLVGGNATLWQFGQTKRLSKNFTLTINPEIGYFLTKNLVLGVGSLLNVPKGSSNSWSLSPFVRYYQPLLPRLSVFGEARVSWYNTSTYDFQGVNQKFIQDQYALSLGYTYFLSQRVALEGSLYNYSYLKTKIATVETTVNHEFGVQAKVRYFLN